LAIETVGGFSLDGVLVDWFAELVQPPATIAAAPAETAHFLQTSRTPMIFPFYRRLRR
jgi:hypothetical protein